MIIRFYITFIFLSLAFSGLYGQTNRALFVAIDKYPANSGWAEIHATNDQNIVIPMLMENGYNKKKIKVLLNEKATKKAIVNALQELYRQSRKGDYIYIHFSCHGQQMADDNGDEPDGLDEALIPYDARRRYSKGIYEGGNHLRDDELGYHIDRIRTKTGDNGNLTVVLDACHSGTGTRDEDNDVYVRGTSYIFAPANYTSPEKDAGKFIVELKTGSNLAPITVFSACLDDEVNYEYKTKDGEYYGSLSYIFCKMISSSYKMSNSEFSERLKKEMKALFAGKRWKQTPYMETTNNNKIFRISGKAHK